MLKKFLFASALLFLPLFAVAFPTQEYDSCYQKAADDVEVGLCMKAETQRILKDIQEVYINISNHPQTKAWNNGNGLISGNLKEMYNSWLSYRDKYCSLFEVASENTFGSPSYDRERCLLELTLDHYQLVHAVITNANTGPEEESGHEHD